MLRRYSCLLLALGATLGAGCGSVPLLQRKPRLKTSVVAAHEHVVLSQLEPVRFEHPPQISLAGPSDEPTGGSAGLDVGDPKDPSQVGLFLGIGEAPYDDGLPPNDLQFHEVNGFSDSLVHVSYEAPLRERVRWFSQLSATRFQSQSLMETLQDGDFAWVTVGLRFAW